MLERVERAEQPDIALLRPQPDDYAQELARPEDILRIIEVADASLAYDRDQKLPHYAESGVEKVWTVDLHQ